MTERTPPQIVQAAEYPPYSLAAFIGQELEAWKFNVRHTDAPDTLIVYPPGRELGITLTVKVAVRENDK